jgi:hypothetical protein
MAGLDPAIHAFSKHQGKRKAWMAAFAAMTA